MEAEIVIPDEVPVMTLPDVAFFPQALMPLHIFEPRYREMLSQVLATNRLFAVAGLDPTSDPGEERLHRVATIGIVRACNKNEDGTSNLLLQGLARIACNDIMKEDPYRIIRIQTLTSIAGAASTQNMDLRQNLEKMIALKKHLGANVPDRFSQFLQTVEDPETFVDLAAFTLCDDSSTKQQLLETLDIHQRLKLFARCLRRDITDLQLRQRLQGSLPDDDIVNN